MKGNRDLQGSPNQNHTNLKSWGASTFDNNHTASHRDRKQGSTHSHLVGGEGWAQATSPLSPHVTQLRSHRKSKAAPTQKTLSLPGADIQMQKVQQLS